MVGRDSNLLFFDGSGRRRERKGDQMKKNHFFLGGRNWERYFSGEGEKTVGFGKSLLEMQSRIECRLNSSNFLEIQRFYRERKKSF